MSSKSWRVAPILGVRNVRQAAEYYRDVLGFRLYPGHAVIQPTADEPGGPRVARYGIRELEVEDENGYRLTFGQRSAGR